MGWVWTVVCGTSKWFTYGFTLKKYFQFQLIPLLFFKKWESAVSIYFFHLENELKGFLMWMKKVQRKIKYGLISCSCWQDAGLCGMEWNRWLGVPAAGNTLSTTQRGVFVWRSWEAERRSLFKANWLWVGHGSVVMAVYKLLSVATLLILLTRGKWLLHHPSLSTQLSLRGTARCTEIKVTVLIACRVESSSDRQF